jgi:hypothetical protein
VVCQHSHQLLFVLGFEQVFDGSRRELGEGFVGGCKNGKGSLFKVFTSPAALTAAIKVLNCPAPAATPTMVFC